MIWQISASNIVGIFDLNALRTVSKILAALSSVMKKMSSVQCPAPVKLIVLQVVKAVALGSVTVEIWSLVQNFLNAR